MKNIIQSLETLGQTNSIKQVDDLNSLCDGDLPLAHAFKNLLSQSHDQVCIQFPDDDDDK